MKERNSERGPSPAPQRRTISLTGALCVTRAPLSSPLPARSALPNPCAAFFPSPCNGEDEGEGPNSARDSFRARFKILPLFRSCVEVRRSSMTGREEEVWFPFPPWEGVRSRASSAMTAERILNRARKESRAGQGPSPSILSLAGRGEERRGRGSR